MSSTPLPPALGAHRVLGNGRTAALLDAAADIDWWCGPELDSTPVLWRLLDPAGAVARWAGVLACEASGPVAGPCQRTVVRAGTDRVECLDGLLTPGGDLPVLVRLVRALDRPVALVHELSAGGFDAPRATWEVAGGRVSGEVDGRRLVVVASSGRSEVDGERVRTHVQVERDRWQCVVLAFGDAPAPEPEALRAQLLAAAELAERPVRDALVPRRHGDRVRDALRVLQACTYSPTGAVVASLTTSLPEAPGDDRQFDYRYTWLRDASLAVSVASLLGQADVARRFLAFARVTIADDPRDTPPLVTVRGGRAPAEREVAGVTGWAGSLPVRIGNDAAGQRQYDALGLFVECVSVHLQTGGRLDRETWDAVMRVADSLADEVLSGEHPLSSGIWELREPVRTVNDDVGRWLALDRAIWIGRVLRPWHRRGRWLRARDQVRKRVLAVMGEDGSLPQSYGEDAPTPDASALAAAVFGLVGDDRRAGLLVDWVLGRLGAGPYVHRYPPGLPGEPAADGFRGREGSFLPMAFWAVAALAAVGREDEAERRLADLVRQLPALLPEEVDPADGRGLGNTPLLWSHMALARAVYILQAAQLRRRYGAVGFTLWRTARYLRLRSGASRS